MTFPAVAPQAPIDETSSVSRQAHAQSPIDGRQWESVKHGAESARCYAAFVPRYRGRNCTLSSDANQNRGASGIHEPPSGGPHIGGAPATPIAALSGSQHKAPGFAGGYLLGMGHPQSGRRQLMVEDARAHVGDPNRVLSAKFADRSTHRESRSNTQGR